MDTNTRRQKQQALITELLERKIRMHARHRYDERGQTEGFALQDWVEAESEVLEKNVLAPLYRKSRSEGNRTENFHTSEPLSAAADSSAGENRT